jgi:hypothetical protein
MKLEFIFSEFGSRNQANQRWKNPLPRLDPTYGSVKKYFPEAKLTLYTDQPEIGNDYNDVEIRYIDVNNSPFNKSNKRWGWHCCDYYQVVGLLKSLADVAISVDSDLMFTTPEVRSIIPIIKKFGVCVPTNERQLVKVDAIHTRGNDGDYKVGEDESLGNLLTYDLWWAGFDTSDIRARQYLQEFKSLMETNPKRAPLQMTRAAWTTGIFPYSTPQQWGVGSGYVGCGNEIILHLGHENVQDYYLEERL